MDWFTLYVLTRFNTLSNACLLASMALALATTIICIVGSVQHDVDKRDFPWSLLKKVLVALAISTAGVVLTPTRSDIALIVAGHWATHNEEMAKLPDNVVRTLNSLLETAQTKLSTGATK